jgi:phosphatidylglycerophosphate synthase
MGGSTAAATQAAAVAWLLEHRGAQPVEIFGLTPAERLRRTLASAGCARVEGVDAQAPPAPPAQGGVLVFRTDWILDERLVRALCSAPDTALVIARASAVAAHVPAERAGDAARALAAGGVPAGVRVQAPDQLVPPYTAQLRKFEPAWALEAKPENARAIERRAFSASYKGVTDLITKWVWPRPAAATTRWLARRHVHPNTITIVSWLLAALAFWLFSIGQFGLGLCAAWLMTFLDTVDGKLARVTLTSSTFGNVLDHSLDLVHPPFWYWAWAHTLPGSLGWAAGVVIAGYFAGRLLEGLFLLAFKMESHCWRPIDSLFRTITARRNPNLIFLSVGAFAGRPDLGLMMVAVWTLISFAFHTVRMVQAFALRRRGGVIEPWDERLRGALAPNKAASSSVEGRA